MRCYFAAAFLAAVVAAGPAGCGKQEADTLKARVGQLERELAEARGMLQERDRQLAELEARAEQSQAYIEGLTAELVKVKVERDKLKQELAALNRKTR
jgi:septal ring factor EnvC (AmiA/AmiB activator)